MKLCDLTVEQYLGLSQAWSTGVWIVTSAAIVAGAWIWKRWKAKKAAAALAEELPSIPIDLPECGVVDDATGARCHLMPEHPAPHVGPKIFVWM